MLKQRHIIFVSILLSWLGVSALCQSQPNILFIFADDWGYGDLSCHGHAYVKTPNIDRLAEEGVDFTNFTVASAICSPSRTGVLTGCFPARFNVTDHFSTTASNKNRNQGDWVDPDLVMLPRLLNEAGYATAHFGKWHLSSGLSDAPVPNVYGYDEVAAFNSSAPRTPVHDDAKNAIAFVQKSHKEGKPFFINMWLHEPHTPFHTRPEYLARFSDLDENDKIYASVLAHADDRIGQVLAELDRLGLKENTLVIFSSDNGPAGTGKKGGKSTMDEATGIVSGHGPCMGTTGGRKGRKGTLWQGGIGLPFIARWPGKIPAGQVDAVSWISAVDLLPTFCEVAGVTLPPDYHPDGISQLATLKGEQSPLREKLLFWKRQAIGKGAGTGADYAILDGKWKLLASINSDEVELYDVSIDPYEKHDVQEEHPELVKELVKKLEDWKATLPAHPDPKCFSKERGIAVQTTGVHVPKELFENVNDYGFMWWEDGVRNTSNHVFKMRTSRYALSFDFPNLQIKEMGIVAADEGEAKVLRATEAECFKGALPTVFTAVMEANGKRYKATGGTVLNKKHSLNNCQLVESGKYYNRRFLNDLIYEPGTPAQDKLNSGVEIVSWPDRLLFLFRFVPTKAVVQGMVEMSLDLDDKFSMELTEGGGHALLAKDGTGYVLLPTPGAELLVDASRAKVTVRSPKQDWSAASENAVGLIVYPVSSDGKTKLSRAVDAEKGAPMISAQQLEPSRKPIKVEYDHSFGYYNLNVFNEGSGDDRFDRSQMVINNTAPHDRQIRIRFEKERNARATGQILMLRDGDGNPLGIPVQISKDWHDRQSNRYAGTWLMGLTMLTVPANTSTTIELVTANAHWGKIPAASTAQLSLVGWGGNQQWNQSAIGNWGENLCYDTDQCLKEVSLTDMRAMYSNTGTDWGGNVGGAGFLRYYLDATKLMGRKGMRTHYRRYSPNMTEVTYASRSRDDCIDQEFTAIEYRTNDMTRGIFRIRMEVRSDLNFADFVFFQMGSENYNLGDSDKLAVGNENGVVKEWTATKGGHTYRTPKTEAKGKLPWFSYHGSREDIHRKLIGANRGLVIRSWNARINGVDKVSPYWAEFGSNGLGWTNDTSLINIVPPPEVKGFQAGDYLEAEIEVIIIPKKVEEYVGPNVNLKKALARDVNTWKMMQREVLGNDISVELDKGTLQKTYPIQIKVAAGNVAQFKVTGGIGFVPLTFTGVNGYRDPVLEENVNGFWKKIDQSNYGKDFWQADFHQGSWEITYNVNLDSPEDARVTREFRFSINN